MSAKCFIVLSLLAVVCFEQRLVAEDLEVGATVTEFTVKDDQDKDWKSKDHVGKKYLVVYFYPADMTGGCTKQACSYRDGEKELAEAGVEVVGVSGDTVANHQIFKKAHSLNFTLLADTEGQVAKAFGVKYKPGAQTVVKEIEGKKVELKRELTTPRWTFVVDLKGKVIYKNTSVKPEEDLKQVLEVIKKSKDNLN